MEERMASDQSSMSFGELLERHLKNGTRPDGKPGTLGKRWLVKEFASRVLMNERTARNWLKGKNLPNDLTTVERELFGNNEAYRDWRREFREAFDAVSRTKADARVASDWSDPLPYPGLRPFTFEEAPIFFGREREVDALVDRLRDPTLRLLAVVGASGTGKSSLVRAGLLPCLRKNIIEGSRNWPVLAFTPGFSSNDPFTALAIELHHRLPPACPWKPTDIAEALTPIPKTAFTSAPTRLLDYADILLANHAGNSRLVLFIDQFEELFTSAAARYTQSFIELLTQVADSASLCVIITLRADFLPQCMSQPTLTFATLLQASRALFPLGSPGPVALLDMIREPAQRAGLVLDEGLAEEILKDAGSNPGEALPLVAFCLKELYRRIVPGHRLTLDAYRAMGGLRGAIGRRTGELLEEIRGVEEPALDAVLAQVFRTLVHVDATGRAARQRASREILMTAAASIPQLVETLIKGRLLLVESANCQVVVTLTHEALLQEWPALREWLERNHAQMQRVQMLLLHFGSTERQDRRHAMKALGDIGLVAPEIMTALLTAFGDAEEDPWVRRAAAESLGKIGLAAPEVMPALISAFDDVEEHPSVREAAAEALWKIGPAAVEAMPALVAALNDPDDTVCKAAIRGLQGIGAAAAEVMPALLAFVGNPERSEQVRGSAAYALAYIAPTVEVVPALLAALRNPEETELRESASTALGIIGSLTPEVIPALRTALDDADFSVREAATHALRSIESNSAWESSNFP